MTSVVVFDYGFGNVRSMVRALADLDLDVTLTSDHRQALEADGLVVPGVGAFGACMEGLKSVGGDTVIKDRLRAGRPVLGVCVGEQIMFERGMEHGTGTPGLGLIKGDVELLDADVVPHMGWDTVEAPEGSVLMKGVENERFYFVHSYYVTPDNPAHTVGETAYGAPFTSAVARDNIFATQFHPEKSAEVGLRLYRNFVHWQP